MSTFDDRERGFETNFAREEEMAFRVTARRNRLLGKWAAGKLGLSGDEVEAYATAVVQADFQEPGDEDVVRKLVSDFAAASVAVDDAEIQRALGEHAIEARRQIMEAQ